jgi:putative transposase
MPSRNRVKVYVNDSYYHVYNRGLNKQPIFKDDYDYSVFLNLLKRYLSNKVVKDKVGREYDSLNGRIELLAFCLMPNHFHLLIYQNDEAAMTALLRRVSTAYSAYFNKKYKRSGALFQERFKANRISKDEYLAHISRYIHMNPNDYRKWKYSSLPYYMSKQKAEWIKPEKILDLFENDYMNFLKEYEDRKKMLEEIELELASR